MVVILSLTFSFVLYTLDLIDESGFCIYVNACSDKPALLYKVYRENTCLIKEYLQNVSSLSV